METRKGYVYVMMNPSYGNMVKIGKTTKEPEERAKELSASTGVATPFIVVYKRLFNDCHTAEKLAHAILGERGCRVNDSREFFAVSIPDAIDLLLSLNDDEEECMTEDFGDSEGNDSEDLGKVYYDQAEAYHYGWGDTFQDIDMALDYYEKSASLGYNEALLSLGRIYRESKNYNRAIRYLQQGANKGVFACYAQLGFIYLDKEGSFYNEYNGNLAWSKYFASVDKEYETGHIDWNNHILYIIGRKQINMEEIPIEHEQHISTYTEHIIREVISLRESMPNGESMFSKVIVYLNKLEEKMLLSEKNPEQLENNFARLTDSRMNNLFQQPYSEDSVGKFLEHLKNYKENLSWSDNAKAHIAQCYSMLAHRFLTGIEGFPERPAKALWLFKESASLGDIKAHAFIGISWVANKNLDNANKAWREFYNHVYDEIEASNSQLPSEKAEDYLKTFLSIFDCAIDNECTNLIHRYYVIATFILGYFDYFSKRCEELEEEYDTLTDKLPQNPIEATDISELSEEEIDLLTNYTRVEKEKNTLEKVYRYIREVAINLQKEYGNTTAMIYRIED